VPDDVLSPVHGLLEWCEWLVAVDTGDTLSILTVPVTLKMALLGDINIYEFNTCNHQYYIVRETCIFNNSVWYIDTYINSLSLSIELDMPVETKAIMKSVIRQIHSP
jgi:hypothetical protein